MNTLTPLNPDVKPEPLPERPTTEERQPSVEPSTDTSAAIDYSVPDVEIEQPVAQANTAYVNQTTATPAAFPTPHPVAPAPAMSGFNGTITPPQTSAAPTSGFLVGYITSLFAGVSVLYGLSSLGFILLDHFIKQPTGVKIGNLFDASALVSTWHVWLVASLLTFATLYLILSRFAGKHIAEGLIPERQMQAAEVARSIFTAILVISATGLIASLLFTLLNTTLAAAEVDSKDLMIQIFGTIAVFIWVVTFVRHQTVIHQSGRNGIPGAVLTVGVLGIATVAAIFLMAAGRNAVIDSRTMSDLSTIQSELITYKGVHDSYPDALTDLPLKDDAIKTRLSKYTYSQKETAAPISTPQSFSFDDSSDSSDSMYDFLSDYQDTKTQSSKTSSYKLCANFLTDASAASTSTAAFTSQSTSSTATFSNHDKGEHCVERDQ